MGVIYELYGIPVYDDDIYHSGIKGMHWGIRRYQNPDGTLTPEGRKRYNVGSDGNLYDKETGKKYGLSTKAKVGIGAGAAALAGGAALAADQIFNGGRGRQAIGQFVGNNAQKVWNGAKDAAGKAGDWVGDRAQDVSDWWTGENNGTRAMRGQADHYNKLANVTKDWDANASSGYSARANMLNNMADKYASGGVSDKISNAANWVGDRAQTAWNGARNTAGQVGNWVGDRAQDVGNWAKDTATDFWKGQETGRVTPNGNAIRTGGAREILNNAGDWVKDTYNDVGDWATRNFGTDRQQMDRFRNYDINPNNIGNQIRNGVSNAANWVGDTAQNAWNGAREGVSNAANWVGDTATDFWKGQETGRVTPNGNAIRTGGAREFLNNAGDWAQNAYNDARTGISNAANAVGGWAQNTYNNARDAVSGWFNNPQSAANGQTQGNGAVTTLSSNYESPDVSGFMDSIRQQAASDRLKKIGTAAAVGGTTAGAYGATYNNAFEQAKKAGYSDNDAHRIAIGRAVGAGAVTALGTGIGGGLTANSSPMGAVGGTLAGGVIGGTIGTGLGSRAVQNTNAAQAAGLGNVKIGQRVTLDNGQTGILAGFSTLPNGQVIPILE